MGGRAGSKRAFVAKASSRTYRVVFRPRDDAAAFSASASSSADHDDSRVLQLVRAGQDVSAAETLHYRSPHEDLPQPHHTDAPALLPDSDLQQWDSAYRAEDYELGDLGLPDDGYDYAKHLKQMRGPRDGAVFVEAQTAPVATARDDGDAQHRAKTHRDRIQNPDLDEVMRQLDSSDSDDASSADGDDTAGSGVVLDDDFITVANAERLSGVELRREATARVEATDRVETTARVEDRVLDKQFERLLHLDYASEDDDDAESHAVSLAGSRIQELAHSSLLTQNKGHIDAGEPDILVTTSSKRFLISAEDTHRDMEVYEATDSDDDEWDCETILSTYTNLENHPSVIGVPTRTTPHRPQIVLDRKLSAPADYLPQPSQQADSIGEERLHAAPALAARQRNESKEDKKARKKLVRDQRRARRQDKSQMKQAFRGENVRQAGMQVALGEAKVAVHFE